MKPGGRTEPGPNGNFPAAEPQWDAIAFYPIRPLYNGMEMCSRLPGVCSYDESFHVAEGSTEDAAHF